MPRQNRIRPFVLIAVVLAVTGMIVTLRGSEVAAGIGNTGGETAARAEAPLDRSLMQFMSGGHMLGFGSDALAMSNASYALRVGFVDANAVKPQAEGNATIEGAHELSRVTYPNLWNGITLAYDRGEGILQSTYRIEPFADPTAIRLRYNAPVHLNEDGTLTTRFETGEVHETAPVAWQEIGGERKSVPVQFAIQDTEVAFAVGAYDASEPLYVDPTMTWNTFLGGTSYEFAAAVAVDGSGNVYVVGGSDGSWGSPLNAFSAPDDGFVAKLSPAGALVWHTFLGTSGYQYAYDVALDGSGNVYVTGYSDASWGTPVRAYSAGRMPLLPS